LSSLTEVCKKGQSLDTSKDYARCCYYKYIKVKKTQKRIRVKVCSRLPKAGEKKTELDQTKCKSTEFADNSKGYFRCCYNEIKEVGELQPKLKLKICRKMKQNQLDEQEALTQALYSLVPHSNEPEIISEEQLVLQ